MDDREQQEKPRGEVYRVPADAPRWPSEEREEVSLVEVLNVLLRHRWKVLGLPVVLAAIAIGWSVLQPPRFTADTTFMPQTGEVGGGQLSRLSGVASQFGIDVPSGQAGQTPQFYADLLASRRLLEDAVTSKYRPVSGTSLPAEGEAGGEARAAGSADDGTASSASDSLGTSLVELYDIQAASRAAAISLAAGRLKEAISVSTNPETGVVELSVTAPWPSVSKQVAERLIELVNQFNNRVRQSQASAQAEFVADRLAEVERELRVAEDSLETFLQRNVGWQQSPELRFHHDRLQRRVNLKQQVYTSLATRYEEARIDEVRSTPVVTTITEPEVPVRPDSSRLLLKAVLGLVLGGILGVFWAFGSEFRENVQQENTDDYREFVSLKEDAAEDLRRAGRRVRRLLGSGSGEDG